MLSAVLLGIVLVRLEPVFGIPVPTLYFLAVLPCLFAIYDFYCYRKVDQKIGAFLKAIAIMNVIYCCLSIGLAVYHQALITGFGWMYILVEVLIVGALAFVEYEVGDLLIKERIVRP